MNDLTDRTEREVPIIRNRLALLVGALESRFQEPIPCDRTSDNFGFMALCCSLQPTWWVPVAVPIQPAALGPPTPEPAGDWRELEVERVARLGATLGEQLVPELGAAEKRHKPLFS